MQDLELAVGLHLVHGHAGVQAQQRQPLGSLVEAVHAQLGDDPVRAAAGRQAGCFALRRGRPGSRAWSRKSSLFTKVRVLWLRMT